MRPIALFLVFGMLTSAGAARAGDEFENGFEDELGRIAAHGAVAVGRGILTQILVGPPGPPPPPPVYYAPPPPPRPVYVQPVPVYVYPYPVYAYPPPAYWGWAPYGRFYSHGHGHGHHHH